MSGLNGLRKQQKKMLLFQARHRTVQTWAAACEFDSVSVLNLNKRFIRLAERGLTKRLADTPYGDIWRLTTKAAKELGIENDDHLTKGPAPGALGRDMAVLRYVFLSEDSRERLIPTELPAAFGAFPEKLLTRPYVFEPEARLLTCLRYCDSKSEAGIGEDIAQEVLEFEHAPHPFPHLIERGLFRIVVLTFDDRRAAAIASELPASKTIPLSVESVPLRVPKTEAAS